ncbi:hypothetical protein [Mycobacterium asiaticum]|uniref:hypothetical protein n=1 Tax=Mycobacterium asiaticum TaxID=1790 RepID=UPI000AE88170|nr:hypothetical protein [Mycobacterium asiaticum]
MSIKASKAAGLLDLFQIGRSQPRPGYVQQMSWMLAAQFVVIVALLIVILM